MAANILKHITKLYDLKWVVRNGQVLAEDRGAVVVSNHQSTLDVLGKRTDIRHRLCASNYTACPVLPFETQQSCLTEDIRRIVIPVEMEARPALSSVSVLYRLHRNNILKEFVNRLFTGIFNFWHLVDKLAVVAKKELFYVWPFGLAAYLAGVVFVDRKDAKGAYQQLKEASEVMNKNKTKLWLFPEGTRNRDHTKLLPFKKGAFVIAVTAQTPIIPVVFSPYYFIDENKYIFNRGHVIVNCLEPVSTKGMTLDDVPELMERVHRRMDNVYKELGKEVLNNLPSGYINSLNSSNK